MSDLTDRMRTCAAFIKDWNEDDENSLLLQLSVMLDAADLLTEAANKIDSLVVSLPPQGEPMAIIPPADPTPPIPPAEPSVWIAPGGPLPGLKQSGTTSSRACPRCDSRGYKRVYRVSCAMMIACQVCGYSWEFGK